MTRRIKEDCASLINLAETSKTGGSMLIVSTDYPEYKKYLESKGYKSSAHIFGEMATITVKKV